MKTLIRLFAILLLITACGEKPRNQGASNGGGGYVITTSEQALEEAVKVLENRILRTAPGVFSQLPEGWDRTELLRVIKNVKMSPLKLLVRNEDGKKKELMMDYGVDKNGPYIEVLKPFFHTYAWVPVSQAPDLSPVAKEFYEATLNEIGHKLIHELAHHFPQIGDDDDKAEAFAHRFQDHLRSNYLVCRWDSTSTIPFWGSHMTKERLAESARAFEQAGGALSAEPSPGFLWVLNPAYGHVLIGSYTSLPGVNDDLIQKLVAAIGPSIPKSTLEFENFSYLTTPDCDSSGDPSQCYGDPAKAFRILDFPIHEEEGIDYIIHQLSPTEFALDEKSIVNRTKPGTMPGNYHRISLSRNQDGTITGQAEAKFHMYDDQIGDTASKMVCEDTFKVLTVTD